MNAYSSNYYGEAPLQATEGAPDNRQNASSGANGARDDVVSMDMKQKGVDEIHATLKEEVKALDAREEANFKSFIDLKLRQMEVAIRESAVTRRERAVVETEKTVNRMLEDLVRNVASETPLQGGGGPGTCKLGHKLTRARLANDRSAFPPPPNFDHRDNVTSRPTPYPTTGANYFHGITPTITPPGVPTYTPPPYRYTISTVCPAPFPPAEKSAYPIACLRPPQKDEYASKPTAPRPTEDYLSTKPYPYPAPNQSSAAPGSRNVAGRHIPVGSTLHGNCLRYDIDPSFVSSTSYGGSASYRSGGWYGSYPGYGNGTGYGAPSAYGGSGLPYGGALIDPSNLNTPSNRTSTVPFANSAITDVGNNKDSATPPNSLNTSSGTTPPRGKVDDAISTPLRRLPILPETKQEPDLGSW